jgi:radical SAM protein with 4Fe4S-binding SPASM domain
MKFHRVHIEVTNICGLACSFCPPKLNPSKSMTLDFFEKVIVQLKNYTKTLAFHVMGDPLLLSNLISYLDIAKKHNFEVELTTSGYFLVNHDASTLFHGSVRQLNISLNSFNKNSLNLSFDEYISRVLDICSKKIASYPKPFINLRLWNLDVDSTEEVYNQLIFERLNSFFDISIDTMTDTDAVKSLRLAPKILLNFDNYFEWPSLKSEHNSHASCYGLSSHFGILADGRVVPCCLDGDGVINLGNLHNKSLKDILTSQRAKDIVEGFKAGFAVEELCKKCTFKDRFLL